MVRRYLSTGTFHRVVEHGGILYLSGIVSDDLTNDFGKQADQIFAKADDLLEKYGSDRRNILSSMIYITDIDDKKTLNERWLQWLPPEHLPARATIGVAQLAPDVLIEIVLTAATLSRQAG